MAICTTQPLPVSNWKTHVSVFQFDNNIFYLVFLAYHFSAHLSIIHSPYTHKYRDVTSYLEYIKLSKFKVLIRFLLSIILQLYKHCRLLDLSPLLHKNITLTKLYSFTIIVFFSILLCRAAL